MKNKKLRDLINQLTKDIMQGTEEPFYELCPKFNNCSHKVEKKCLFDYKGCLNFYKK